MLYISESQGLDDIFYIIKNIKTYLNKQGTFLCEAGYEQKKEIIDYCLSCGWKEENLKYYKDLSGRDRILEIVND